MTNEEEQLVRMTPQLTNIVWLVGNLLLRVHWQAQSATYTIKHKTPTGPLEIVPASADAQFDIKQDLLNMSEY